MDVETASGGVSVALDATLAECTVQPTSWNLWLLVRATTEKVEA